jgi:O-antigen ligase
MKKLVFPNGIYTVLRPLYYLCKIFGLASYSYVADRRNNRVTPDYGYLNYMFTVIWLVVLTVGVPVQIVTLRSFVSDSKTLFVALISCFISSYTSSIVAAVWLSVIKRIFLEIIENISESKNKT